MDALRVDSSPELGPLDVVVGFVFGGRISVAVCRCCWLNQPGGGRDHQDGLLNLLGDGHPDRVRQPAAPLREPGDELESAARGIGADQCGPPRRCRSGSLARASWVAVTWSAAVLLPALPPAAPESPVPPPPWSPKPTSGWCPKDFFQVAAPACYRRPIRLATEDVLRNPPRMTPRVTRHGFKTPSPPQCPACTRRLQMPTNCPRSPQPRTRKAGIPG